MTDATCDVHACPRPPHNNHIHCRAHKRRLDRTGSTDPYPGCAMTPVERFVDSVLITETCWLWTGHISTGGYGRMMSGPRKDRHETGAHRFGYELIVGPVPDGLVLDHLCRVRRCVNPSHLEPVTDAENIRRGVGPSARSYQKPACIHGHRFTAENTLVSGGARYCRACMRRRKQERKRRLEGAAA